MQWINLTGVMVMIALLIPNIIYVVKHVGVKPWHVPEGRLMHVLEQVARYGVMVLMCLRIPLWAQGYAAPAAQVVWLSLVMPLLLAYCLLWVFYFRKRGKVLGILLAAIPSAVFLLSGFLWQNLPLTLLAILFTVLHIRVTWINHRSAEEQ